jgi:hypothetical protein
MDLCWRGHGRCCRLNLAELGNFEFVANYSSSERSKEEYCACKRCGEGFLLHYDFFDSEGHIQPFVFGQDINDPMYNWQNALTPEQVATVEQHLKGCNDCSRLLNEEMLSDAWFGAVMHQKNPIYQK